MKTKPIVVLAAAWLAASLAPAQAEKAQKAVAEKKVEESGPRPLTVDDYFRLQDVSDPRISPEGAWIAYEVSSLDLEDDESDSRIWMVPAAGGAAVPMTAKTRLTPGGSASSPRWSPDGKYLAFLALRDGSTTQVWTLFRQGGDAMQLTDTAQGVKAFEWSPDGSRMVLMVQDPTPQELAAKEKGEKKSDEEEVTPPWVIDRQQFKEDYTGYLDRRRTHLFVLDVASKELTQITSGDYDDSEPAWSPDGQRIAFTSNRTENPDANYDTDVWVVRADAAPGDRPLTRVTLNPGPDHAPAWSPDGSTIACISATDTAVIVYATNHLAVAPAAGGGELKVLTAAVDRNVLYPRFSADGAWIYFLLETSGEQRLVRIPAGGGEVETMIGGERAIDQYDMGADGTIAALITEVHLPSEVFAWREGEGGEPVRLTHVNDDVLSKVQLGDVEKVQYHSPDGTEVEGFIVKPVGFESGHRYPTILWIHGGPVAQYDYRFDYEVQLFAGAGYVVVLPNPRGSSGYGQDYTMGIWQSWGNEDFEDVVAGVDDAIARGYADPERLGVGGWSYGGMLTNHVITKSQRFKAAITGASATLYVVNYGHDQYQRWWEYELGLPWRDRKLWEELSPFNRVENVTAPTLIVGGEKDWNVPIINSEQLFLALKRLGRTTELVVYPEQFHHIDRPSYTKDLYQRYLEWYAKYLGGESGG